IKTEVGILVDKNNLIGDINENNVIGSAVMTEAAHIVIADEVIYSFLGVSRSITITDYIHPDYKEKFMEYFKNCSDTPVTFVTKCKRHDGEYVNISVVMQNKEIDGKKYVNMDIYDILFMTDEYKGFIANNKVFNALIALSDKVFFRYDVKTRQIVVYDGKKNYFSGSIGLYCSAMTESGKIQEEHLRQFRQMCEEIEKAKKDGFYKINTKFFNPEDDEKFYPTVFNFTTVEFNSQVSYVVGFYSGGVMGSGADSYTSNRSNLDPLTSLLNKKAIKDYALEELARAAKNNTVVTLVMIDLDNFKTINDTYGHMFGDETLVSVARVMTDAVGDRGVVGRIGGDEFFIVLTGFEDGYEAIRPVIRSIRSHVEWCFKNKLDDIKVTCSVGTASYPADADNYDDLFKLADHCLYIAKSKGRDRFIIYTKSIHGTLEEILSNGTVIQMANFVSEADKTKHLLSVIKRFNSAESYDAQQVVLKKIMLEILYYYDVDAIQYYSADPAKPHYEVANFTVTEPERVLGIYDDCNEALDKKGYFALGNYDNAKTAHPPVYQYMVDHELYSIMLILDRNDDDSVNGVFSISTHKRYQKWASFDINMLLIICRLMERFVR
ncbi:MAG: GGDEF domain-containing protein, partial [Firmicutes bacterium]|nr:GGDEF domain-containing protein [Bacillota bacterium]